MSPARLLILYDISRRLCQSKIRARTFRRETLHRKGSASTPRSGERQQPRACPSGRVLVAVALAGQLWYLTARLPRRRRRGRQKTTRVCRFSSAVEQRFCNSFVVVLPRFVLY